MMEDCMEGARVYFPSFEGGREYFLPEFKEYMKRELKYSRIKISDHNTPGYEKGIRWVFWNRQDDDHSVDSISDACARLKIRLNIRHVLCKLILYPQLNQCLVQFWASKKTSEGRTLLTTQLQPFALGTTLNTDWRNQLCEYRMGICREYNNFFYADAESEEEQLGLLGRVFLNKLPEHAPKAKHYTLKEYPQRDLAIRCEIFRAWAVPVFEQSSPTCVGVLEMACNITHHYDIWHDKEFQGRMYDIFQKFGLRCFDGYKHCKIQDGGVMLQQVQQDQPSMDAINNGMYVNSEAQNDNLPSLDSLQNGKVTMQVDSSDQLSMDASSNGQNVVTAEQNILVVPSSKERKRKTQDRKYKKGGLRIDIPKKKILKYSHLNRKEAAGKLRVGISTFKRVCRGHRIDRWPPRNIGKIQPSLPSSVENQGQTPQLNFDFPSNQATGTQDRKHKKGGPGIDIPKKKILKCSHMNLEDAAGKLGIGISTFLRVCRGHGIDRWPPRNIEKIQPSLPSSVENQRQTPQLNFDFPSNQASGTQDRKHKKGGPRIDIPKEEILKYSHMNQDDAAGKLRRLSGGQQTLFSPLCSQDLQSAKGEPSIVPIMHNRSGVPNPAGSSSSSSFLNFPLGHYALSFPSAVIQVWLDGHFSYTPTIDEEETINKCMQDGSFRGEFVDGCWISNTTVIEYSEMLGHYLSHCHFFCPNVIKNFKQNGRLFNTILLPKTEKIFFPILRDRHWMLLVIDVKKKYFLWLDSMRCEREKKYSEDFAHFLNHEFVFKRLREQNEWPIKYPENTPIQDNGNDCGMYMMAFMISLAVGDKLPQLSQEQVKRMRRTICLELEKRDIVPQCPLVDYNFLYIQERKKNEALNEKLHKESTSASRDEVFLVSETSRKAHRSSS